MSTPSLAAETQALRDAYAALNRNDIPAFLAILDPGIVRTEPAGFPSSGTYRGLAALREHLVQARATWAEGACEPEGFAVAGDRIVVCVHVHVRLKSETAWRDGRIADGFAFRGAKAVEWHTFVERREALAWAGVQPSDEA